MTNIASVVEDGTTIDPSLYEVESSTGLLYRLNDENTNFRRSWFASKVVIVYTGGYVLLTTLPRAIEAAVITLVRGRWFGSRRGRSIKWQLSNTGLVRHLLAHRPPYRLMFVMRWTYIAAIQVSKVGRMFAAFIWWIICDRVEMRVKKAEDYITAELLKRWEREGEIALNAVSYKHELEDKIGELKTELRQLKTHVLLRA